MGKKKSISFMIISIAIAGLLVYSTYSLNSEKTTVTETDAEKTESTQDVLAPKEGMILVEKHIAIGAEYGNAQTAYSNGDVSEKEYRAAIEDLQQKELAVFEEARNHDWGDSEIKESNYFFRGVMKFPSPIQTHSAEDVPPVFDDLKKQEYCSLINEFDAAYAEFDSVHPVPEEKNYESAEEHDEALSKHVSLRTNNHKFMELEEKKNAFGNAAYVECN